MTRKFPNQSGREGRAHLDVAGRSHPLGDPLDGGLECIAHLLVHERERIVRDHEPPRRFGFLRLAEEDPSDRCEPSRVAGEPADDVEGGAEREHPVHRDAAEGRTDPEDAAVARGQAHRAAAVRPEREVHEAGRDRGSRAARRAPRHPIRRGRVERRPVMAVLAGQAVRELVGEGLAREVRAGVEEGLHRRGGGAGRPVRFEPGRVPEPRPVTLDLEDVLRRESKPGERPGRGALQRDVGIPAESAAGVIRWIHRVGRLGQVHIHEPGNVTVFGRRTPKLAGRIGEAQSDMARRHARRAISAYAFGQADLQLFGLARRGCTALALRPIRAGAGPPARA